MFSTITLWLVGLGLYTIPLIFHNRRMIHDE
jgi:hypothetical protein